MPPVIPQAGGGGGGGARTDTGDVSAAHRVVSAAKAERSAAGGGTGAAGGGRGRDDARDQLRTFAALQSQLESVAGEAELLRNPAAVLAGLSLEDLRAEVYPRWRRVVQENLRNGGASVSAARGGGDADVASSVPLGPNSTTTRGATAAASTSSGPTLSASGLPEGLFVAVLLDNFRARFARVSLEGATRVLAALFAELDAAGQGAVSWDTIAGFMMDGAAASKRPAGATMNKNIAKRRKSATAVDGDGNKADDDDDDAAVMSATLDKQAAEDEALQIAQEGATLVEDATHGINVIAHAMDFVTRIVALTPGRIACCTRTGALHQLSQPDYALLKTTKLGGYSALAMTYVHDRVLNQAVPGIHAVRSFVAVATSNMRLSIVPVKEWAVRSTLTLPDLVTCLSYSHDDQLLYGGTQAGHALVIRIDNKGESRLNYRVSLATDVLYDIKCISGYRVLIASADQGRAVADFNLTRETFRADATLPPQQVSKNGTSVYSGTNCAASLVAYAARLKLIIAALADFSVVCFAEGCPAVPAYRLDDTSMAHQTGITALGVDRSGTMLFTADKAGMGKLWNLGTLSSVSAHPVILHGAGGGGNFGGGGKSSSTGVHATLCAAVVPHSSQLLINTNTSCHQLRVERPTDGEEGLILEDGSDPIVYVHHSTRDPGLLYVVSSRAVVHWSLRRSVRDASHDSPYVAISAAVIDPTCVRVVLGGNGGELSVRRLDTGRSIRSYAMPARCGEVVSVAWAAHDASSGGGGGDALHSQHQHRSSSGLKADDYHRFTGYSAAERQQQSRGPAQIVALTEAGHFVVCADAGSNEFGDVPLLKCLSLDGIYGAACRRLAAHLATEVYTILDAKSRLHTFSYDAADGVVRPRDVALHQQPHDVTAVAPLGGFPANAVATADGVIAIWVSRPHVLADSCVCRWPNRPTGVGDFKSTEYPSDLPPPPPAAADLSGGNSPGSARSPPASPKSQASGSSFVGGVGGPRLSHGAAVNGMFFVPPYTLVTTDDSRQLCAWDLSDVMLNARLFTVASVIEKAQAVASGSAGCTHFHAIPRNPVVRCVSAVRLPQTAQFLELVQPNVACAIDFTSKPTYFAFTGDGLVPAVMDGGAALLAEARASALADASALAAERAASPVAALVASLKSSSAAASSTGGTPADKSLAGTTTSTTTDGDASEPVTAAATTATPVLCSGGGRGTSGGGVTVGPRSADERSAWWIPPPAATSSTNNSGVAAPTAAAASKGYARRGGVTAKNRARWRKGLHLFKTLWLLTRFLSSSSGGGSSGNLAPKTSSAVGPFRGVDAYVVGVNPPADAPTFHCLSLDWCVPATYADGTAQAAELAQTMLLDGDASLRFGPDGELLDAASGSPTAAGGVRARALIQVCRTTVPLCRGLRYRRQDKRYSASSPSSSSSSLQLRPGSAAPLVRFAPHIDRDVGPADGRTNPSRRLQPFKDGRGAGAAAAPASPMAQSRRRGGGNSPPQQRRPPGGGSPEQRQLLLHEEDRRRAAESGQRDVGCVLFPGRLLRGRRVETENSGRGTDEVASNVDTDWATMLDDSTMRDVSRRQRLLQRHAPAKSAGVVNHVVDAAGNVSSFNAAGLAVDATAFDIEPALSPKELRRQRRNSPPHERHQQSRSPSPPSSPGLGTGAGSRSRNGSPAAAFEEDSSPPPPSGIGATASNFSGSLVGNSSSPLPLHQQQQRSSSLFAPASPSSLADQPPPDPTTGNILGAAPTPARRLAYHSSSSPAHQRTQPTTGGDGGGDWRRRPASAGGIRRVGVTTASPSATAAATAAVAPAGQRRPGSAPSIRAQGSSRLGTADPSLSLLAADADADDGYRNPFQVHRHDPQPSSLLQRLRGRDKTGAAPRPLSAASCRTSTGAFSPMPRPLSAASSRPRSASSVGSVGRLRSSSDFARAAVAPLPQQRHAHSGAGALNTNSSDGNGGVHWTDTREGRAVVARAMPHVTAKGAAVAIAATSQALRRAKEHRRSALAVTTSSASVPPGRRRFGPLIKGAQ